MLKNKFQKVLLSSLLYFALTALYIGYVSELFTYSGFVDEFTIVNFLLGLLTIILIYCLASSDKNLAMYHDTLLALVLVPAMAIFACSAAGYNYYFVTVLAVGIVLAVSKVRVFKSVGIARVNANLLTYGLLLILILYVVSIFLQGGFKYLNFDLRVVYDFRDEAKTNLPSIYAYISPLIGKIILPLYIVVSLIQRKYLNVIIGFFFGVMIFGLTAHKAPLFFPLVVSFVYLFSRKNFGFYIFFGLLGLAFLSILDFQMRKWYPDNYFGLFGSLFGRRSMLLPSLISNFYIEYFTNNEYYYWSMSKVTLGMVTPPSVLGPTYTIGLVYFGDPEINANIGWIGSGFANAGIIGVTVYSVVLGIIVSYLKKVGDSIGPRLVFSVSFILLISIFRSADLITAMLTHGLLFLILLLGFMPKGNYE